ncbi:MAG TPA: hypothetical protein VGG74_05700 [Kofleriaceae bacterium]|jgi:hypothetical protein
MRPGVPASVAICAVYAFLVALLAARVASADDQARRQVAVVDLSAEDADKDLSDALYRALNLSSVLRVPDRRDFDQYLKGPLLDEDGGHIQAARNHFASAENELLNLYDSAAAVAEAANGESELQSVTPTDDVRALYAQLSLMRGLALLDQHDTAGATRAFELSHRLDATAQLDPARYPPDITSAFERAKADVPGTAPLTIQGTGHAWIDGRARGDAPGTFDVELGEHYVVLTGGDRETTGGPVRVAGKSQIEIPDAPASEALQVERARLALSRAVASNDDAARAGAMQQLAVLLGVGDALLIAKRADGKLQWETWKNRAPGFSPPQLYTSQSPATMLEALEPPLPPRPPDPPVPEISITKPEPGAPDEAWYDKKWVQACAATGLAAIVITAILWARRDVNVGIGHNITSGM